MKSIFDTTNRAELINRIYTLTENSEGQWGKMNVYQMLKHCVYWEEWIQGVHKPKYKQEFLGFLFGKLALKGILKSNKPFRKNLPTLAAFQIKERTGDFEADRKKWIRLLEDYENFSNPAFIHDFFGKMTKEEIGILAYKHTDHHLTQFKC